MSSKSRISCDNTSLFKNHQRMCVGCAKFFSTKLESRLHCNTCRQEIQELIHSQRQDDDCDLSLLEDCYGVVDKEEEDRDMLGAHIWDNIVRANEGG